MENAKNQLNFPLKFSGNLNIITSIKSQVYFNLFIQNNNEYPPNKSTYKIYYDFNLKKARVDMINGFESNVIYIRRYDKVLILFL